MIQSKSHRQIISLLTLTFIVTNRYTFCNPKNNITKLFYLHKIKNFYYPTLFQTSSSNWLFIIDRSRVDAILNILLASKESKRARVLVSETSGRADGWKSLQLESPWNNPIFRVYHCSFFTVWSYIEMDAQWYFAFTSRNGTVLFARKRDFSMEGGQGDRGRRGDTRHIQHGNTLTNAFDNVSGGGVGGGRTIVFKILLFSRSPVFRRVCTTYRPL